MRNRSREIDRESRRRDVLRAERAIALEARATAVVDGLGSFGHWFAGLADGEGSFGVYRKSKGRWIAYQCVFRIKVRVDDAEMIETIRDVLGFGRTHYAGGSPPTAEWAAATRDEVVLLTAVLDAFPLRSKKASEYVAWREAVDLWTGAPRGFVRPPEWWERMDALAASIKEMKVLSGEADGLRSKRSRSRVQGERQAAVVVVGRQRNLTRVCRGGLSVPKGAVVPLVGAGDGPCRKTTLRPAT